MDQFVSFEDALKKLNISADHLNELRENNVLRAYRDGSSWKFRGDEIERMANEGVPELPPPSDISLVDPSDLVDAEPLADLNLDDDLGLADLPELDLDSLAPLGEPDESAIDIRMTDTDAISAGSELELAGLEDTVTAGASDISLDAPEEPSDPTDSILLSEEELGESVTGSLSTIIGRKELDIPDADLELELDDVTDDEDTKLSYSSGASDVLSSKVPGSGVLDEMEDLSDAKKAFKDLEELEIDLAAESSLALNPADVADVKQKADKSLTTKSDSDLLLGDDVEVGDENNMGSTDVPLEELGKVEIAEAGGGNVELELAGDDDLILADAGGSDITLDSGDSGINLVAPSDSGLALDDIPLDVGGSAILSSLSLEGSDPEFSLLGSDVGQAATGSGGGLQTDDDFQLTPLSEGGLDDGDSSSQVIALDADLGGFEGGAALLEDGFPAEPDDGVVLTEEFGEAPADMGMGYAAAVAVPVSGEGIRFDGITMVLLSICTLFLLLGGLMVLDMIRNVWTWNDNLAINSSLLDAILGALGMN